MDKKTAIEWLTGFICTKDSTEIAETAELLAGDIDIPLADATKIVTECETLLTVMFEGWLEYTPEELEESEAACAATPVNEAETEAKVETEKTNTDINPDA